MARTVLDEMAVYEPRYPDIVFDGSLMLYGSQRVAEFHSAAGFPSASEFPSAVEFRSMGRGHSEEDVALLLTEERIAFIGDIGFFDCQPFMGFCDIDGYREQVQYFLEFAIRNFRSRAWSGGF